LNLYNKELRCSVTFGGVLGQERLEFCWLPRFREALRLCKSLSLRDQPWQVRGVYRRTASGSCFEVASCVSLCRDLHCDPGSCAFYSFPGFCYDHGV